MGSKRANGEGTIYRTKGGQWKVSLSLGVVNGKRKRVSRNAATRSEAVAILSKLRGDGAASPMANHQTGPISVQQFLAIWLQHVETHRAPATAMLYRAMVDKVISPRLGTIRLASLAPQHIQAFADVILRDGVKPRMRQIAFTTLRAALRFAVKTRRITTDPTVGIDKPQHTRKDINPFTRDEAAKLMKHTKGTRWHALIVLSLTTGMRQGELFGLQWSAIDFAVKKMKISQAASEVAGKVTIRQPKTASSVRVLDLPQVTVDALKDHRAILMKEGNAGNAFVFPAPEGGLMPRSTFRHRYWLPLLAKLELKPRGFHHCRHTYATLALGAGTPAHVVAKVMGHAKASTTSDIYAHVLEAHQTEATNAMQRLFG